MRIMAQRTNCIYCNKPITARSKEHVIQNALGGLYESDDICCPECNNYISKYTDAPFTKIFNPIIAQIDDFSKTNNTKSVPMYTGTVSYQGKKYPANLKGGKVASCPELSRELHCDISKLPLEIISYNFNVDNTIFRQGMAKIAFNYAVSENVDFNYLKHNLKVDKSGNVITDIKYNYPLVPFRPLNLVDAYMELAVPSDVYHNLILFSQHNQLWCYVDLFNTFQYYVLLSETIPANEHIYASYAQTLRKLKRDTSFLSEYMDYKDIAIIAQQYGVEPCMDTQEFSRRVQNVINKTSQIVPMSEIILPRMQSIPLLSIMNKMSGNTNQQTLLLLALQMYMDEDDRFIEQNFRTVTPGHQFEKPLSYPNELIATHKSNHKTLTDYTNMKFNRMNEFLKIYSQQKTS